MTKQYLFFIVLLPLFSFQKVNMGELKRELITAERDLEEAQERVRALKESIAHKEIERIQKDIKRVQGMKKFKDAGRVLTYLDQQREILMRIIDDEMECRQEASEILDQILYVTTEIADLTDRR